MGRLIASLRRAMKVIYWVAWVSLLLIMLLTISDVTGRYLLNKPVLGAHETVELLMVVLVFMGAAQVQFQGGHVVVDVLTTHLKGRAQLIASVLTRLLVLAFLGLLTWQAWGPVAYAYSWKTATDDLSIPFFPFLAVVSVGAFLTCLEVIIEIVESLLGATKETVQGK